MEKTIDEFKKYFILSRKYSYRKRETHIEKYFPIFYKKLIEFKEVNKINTFNLSLEMFLNNINEIPKCNNCLKQLDNLNKKYCSKKCLNLDFDNVYEKIKETNLKKYGNFNYSKTNEYKQNVDSDYYKNLIKKRNENNLKKYGIESTSKTNKFKKTIISKYEKKYKVKIKEDNSVEYKCKKCNHISNYTKKYFKYRYDNNVDLCLNCLPKKESYIENQMSIFLNENNIKFNKNDRNIIKPKEIDFIIDNIGIEMNGLYWHSEKFVDEYFHFEKWKICNENKIKLLTIFEDEWKYKKNIIKSIILSNLNKNNKIFARKTKIKLINLNDYKNFLINNDINGYIYSEIRIGLYYENELYQIIGFNKLEDNNFILNSFSTKNYFNIIGGFSKLLKYFENNFNPNKIITKINLSYFNSNLFEKYNFKFLNFDNNFFYINKSDKKLKRHYDIIPKNENYLKVFNVGYKILEKNYK